MPVRRLSIGRFQSARAVEVPPRVRLVGVGEVRKGRALSAYRVGVVAGVGAPCLLAVVFVVLTLVQRSFLERGGWSALHRSAVEWPSVLELGPQGWVMQAALVVSGALGVIFGVCAFRMYRFRALRVAAALLVLMSCAVAAMAFPPDSPGARTQSWHDAAHNGIYPVIPLTALCAALVLGVSLRPAGARLAIWASRVFVVVAVVALLVSMVDAVAQLTRFVLFGALLAWFVVIAFPLKRPGSLDGR